MMAPYEDELEPYALEKLIPIGRVTLRPRKVNWKNIADNYSDGCTSASPIPGLNRLFGASYNIEAREWVDKMSGELQRTPRTMVRAHVSRSAAGPALPADRQRLWIYFKLWPNVAFDIYPDQIDFMQFMPVTPTESLIREIAYVHPDSRREMKAARYLNWRINRQVNTEDTALINGVQAGHDIIELRRRSARLHGSLPAQLRPQIPRADADNAERKAPRPAGASVNLSRRLQARKQPQRVVPRDSAQLSIGHAKFEQCINRIRRLDERIVAAEQQLRDRHVALRRAEIPRIRRLCGVEIELLDLGQGPLGSFDAIFLLSCAWRTTRPTCGISAPPEWQKMYLMSGKRVSCRYRAGWSPRARC